MVGELWGSSPLDRGSVVDTPRSLDTSASFRTIDLNHIEALFDRKAILSAVRQGFIDHAHGLFRQPLPIHLDFGVGDCHVKVGFLSNDESFTVKLATGFYGNAAMGLPNANGLMFLASQRTGKPLALLLDQGMLTAWRTAAATVLAAMITTPPSPLRLGIIGAGLQGRLAAQWLAAELPLASLSVWSRTPINRDVLKKQFGDLAEPVHSAEKLCADSNLIVTATPSTAPIVHPAWVKPGTHIVALGADANGKIELAPSLLARAAMIVTDDHAQCLDYGEFGHAVRAGLVDADADVALGDLLAATRPSQRNPEDITVADLTGLAAQDNAIAKLFYRNSLGAVTHSPESRR